MKEKGKEREREDEGAVWIVLDMLDSLGACPRRLSYACFPHFQHSSMFEHPPDFPSTCSINVPIKLPSVAGCPNILPRSLAHHLQLALLHSSIHRDSATCSCCRILVPACFSAFLFIGFFAISVVFSSSTPR